MRALNKKTMKKSTRLLLFSMAALMIGVFNTGCSGKKSGGKRGATVPGQIGTGCPSCTSTNLLYQALGRTGTGIEMAANFFATDTTTNVNGNNGYYSGSVGIQGTVYVANGNVGYGGYDYCSSIPLGVYSINMVSPGTMDGVGTITGIDVELTGPALIRMRLGEAYFSQLTPTVQSCNGQFYGTQIIFAQWQIQSLNNYNCQYGPIIGFAGANQPRQCI